MTQPIKYEVAVEDENGKQVVQKVVYDWVPPYCKKCGVAGHDCARKDKKIVQKAPIRKEWKAKPPIKQNHPEKQVEKQEVVEKTASNPQEVEGWTIPKKTSEKVATRTGSAGVSTENTYQPFIDHENILIKEIEGGDRFPSVET